MKNCPNCNASVSDTAKFCNKCGYNFEKKAELFINREFCVNCGAEVPNDSVFCPECGCNIKEQKRNEEKRKAEEEQKRKEIEEKTKNDSVIENGILKKYSGSETNVIIPGTVTEIGEYAFYKCENLTSIEIPNSVTIIGKCAFNCKNLVEIIVHKENKHYLSDNGVLYTKDKKTLVCYPNGKSEKYFSIPTGVTTIGEYAFNKCKNLTSIEIPNSVITIGERAFYECENLTSIEIPISVENIYNNVFYGCKKIKKIRIPKAWRKEETIDFGRKVKIIYY